MDGKIRTLFKLYEIKGLLGQIRPPESNYDALETVIRLINESIADLRGED